MKMKMVALVGLLLAAGSWSHAGDWANWRGPEMNGISREVGLIDDWSLKDKKNVLWVSDIGGRATPIVLNGRVYLNCRTPDDVNDPVEKVHARERVVCWDAKSGEVLWQDVFNVFQTDIPAPRVGWAAMVGDTETGNVFVHSVSGIFRCYTPDGKVVWEYSLYEDFGKISGYGGRTQTPIIDENRVIVSFLERNWGEAQGPAPRHTYYAFDKHDGKLLWTAAPGGAPNDTNYSAPIVTVINGQRMLIGGNADGGIYAMNARTGQPIWGFRMSKRGLNATPVVDGNLVYISHGEDNIDNTRFGRIQCIDGTGTGDVTETHSVWRVDDIKAGYTGLLVKDGILYVVADTGNMHAFDSKTGEALWVHDLGTVGKGSPVWADGKIYVMEVNGNIHIVRPSREKCEKLSHVALPALIGTGTDEIYASPAIADGRIFFVTRDRLICVGDPESTATTGPIPELPKEGPADEEVALLQLVPFEVALSAGEDVSYELHAFDKLGRFIKKIEPALEPQGDLPGAKVEGAKIAFAEDAELQAGHVLAKHGGLEAKARVRVFPKLPWKFDFDDAPERTKPPGWINGFAMLVPEEIDGSMTRKKTVGRGRPSGDIWIGPSDMTDYTIQADVLMREQKRKLPYIGITANRYTFILKGNQYKLSIQSWAPHLRMAKEIRYRSDPDVWYTMKLRVDVEDDGAHVRGKIWKRGEAEPEEWTLETVDPHPNTQGSPGLYVYALSECNFDNIIVSEKE